MAFVRIGNYKQVENFLNATTAGDPAFYFTCACHFVKPQIITQQQ
jgi:hypothetical protein